MASTSSTLSLVLLVIFLTTPASSSSARGSFPTRFFNVVKYGAVSDGKTDNTEAFLKAWKDACAYPGRSRMWIPKGIFVLGSVEFKGYCEGSVAFIIKGTLKATTDLKSMFSDTWIAFRYVRDLSVKGGGVLDGQGHAAWPYNDCMSNPHCTPLPTTLRFDFVTDSKIKYLRSINSKNSHINIFASSSLDISHLRLTAPADSPNTDGIRIGASSKIRISHSVISTGDDCISMVSGSRRIHVSDVRCGPGHGISVGSLGRSHENEYVKGIHVRNCTFVGTDNGVRIKTWAPSLYSVASDITFQDLVMENPRNPIVIDQLYCPTANCFVKGSHSSAVQIQDVTFKNIYGVSSTKVALKLQCSGAVPCKNVKLINIDLAYNGTGGQATSVCSHVIGSSYGKQNPGGCL